MHDADSSHHASGVVPTHGAYSPRDSTTNRARTTGSSMLRMTLRQTPAAALVLLASVPLAGVAAQGRQGGQPAERDTTPRVLVVAGQRAGPSAFPLTNYPETRPLVPGQMDFKHYHTS